MTTKANIKICGNVYSVDCDGNPEYMLQMLEEMVEKAKSVDGNFCANLMLIAMDKVYEGEMYEGAIDFVEFEYEIDENGKITWKEVIE